MPALLYLHPSTAFSAALCSINVRIARPLQDMRSTAIVELPCGSRKVLCKGSPEKLAGDMKSPPSPAPGFLPDLLGPGFADSHGPCVKPQMYAATGTSREKLPSVLNY